MADVFLSYARDDRKAAVELARRLEHAGFSVWWDRYIDGGADFGAEIEREIAAAGSVVVLWSRVSQSSKWVRDEASYGRDADKLLPLCIDGTPPPLGFRQVQALDFSAWTGAADAEVFETLVRSLRRMLERSVGAPPAAPASAATFPSHAQSSLAPTSGRRRRTMVFAAVALLAVLGAAATYRGLSSTAPGAREIVRGQFAIQPFKALPAEPDRIARAATYSDAFRTRFTELGVRNVSAVDAAGAAASEFLLSGEVAREGDKEILTARIDDRATGATLWAIRRPVSEGAIWESNLAGYAVRCALKRRDPARGADLLSRYLYGCTGFLDGDFHAFHAAAKAAYEAAPDDPRAVAFYAVGTVGVGYASAVSRAERHRYMTDARALAERALRQDPKNADAAFAMGMSFDDPQFADQEKWWQLAVESDPESGWAQGRYGNFLATVGRIREAMDMELRAAQNRLNKQISRVARLFAAAGDWREVSELYDRIRPLNPEAAAARELQTYVMFGDVETATRMLDERRALAGPDAGCWDLLLRARRNEPYDRAAFAKQCGGTWQSANLYAIAGDVDGAYREAESLVSSAEPFDAPHLFGPEMDAFRRDPRFWPLVARLGFTQYWLVTGRWPDFCSDPGYLVDCRKAAAEAQAAT